jgi:hypothetical protein
VTVRLDRQLPDGPWRARIALRSGLTERTGAATIRFPHQPSAAQPVEEQSGRLTLLIVGGLVLLAAAALLLPIRHRRASRGTNRGIS